MSHWFLRDLINWRDYVIDTDITTIGGNETCDINIRGLRSSSLLAIIDMDGEFPILRNYHPQSTFVNGGQIPKYGRVLKDEDDIWFGDEQAILRMMSLKHHQFETIEVSSDSSGEETEEIAAKRFKITPCSVTVERLSEEIVHNLHQETNKNLEIADEKGNATADENFAEENIAIVDVNNADDEEMPAQEWDQNDENRPLPLQLNEEATVLIDLTKNE